MTGARDLIGMTPHDPLDAQRRRNVRLTTIVLAAIAIGIYVAFIASAVLKAQH